MTEQPKEQPKEKLSFDNQMRRFREYVTAIIAFLVLIIYPVGVVLLSSLVADANQFDRVKELLLLINPILGFVLGYYFNKASTEARAESAESTAKSAVETAQQATKERDSAVEEAKIAETEASEALETLKEVADAAESMMAEALPTTGTLSIDDEVAVGAEAAIRARQDLQAALDRAKRVIKR